ncbi:MAG: choice-of-anchor D domain-containing protein, partial [Clostridia bacterium]|nr:choice-of-anchor D domain-containing protein [Clostridia bacterium]
TADVEEIDLGTFVAGEVTDANRKTVTLKNVTDQAQTLTFSGDVTVMNSAGAALTEQPLPAGASVQLKIGPADNAAAGEKSTSLIVTEKGGDKLLEIPVTYTVLPQAAKVNIPQHDPVEVIKGQETIFEQTIEYACNAPGTLTLTVGDSGGLTKLYLLNDAGTVVDKLEIPVEATHPGQAASNTWQMQTVTVRIKANDQLNANTLIGYMTAQLGTARKSGQVILLVGEAEYKLYLAPTHVNLGEFAAGQAIGDGVDVYLINKGTKAINYPTPQVTGPLTVTGIPTFGQMGPSAGTLVNIKPSDTQTPGQYAGSVTFVSSNNCQVTLTYEYTVLAQKAFTVTPAALDFGTIKQGAALPAYQTVTVTNTGMDTLAMTYQATAGYAISFSKTSLPKGESAQVTVQPNVNTLGIHTGTLTVSAEGLETQEAALTFTVEGAQALTAAPDTLDWGEMAVGEAAAEMEVRLTNNTGRTLELTVEASEGFDLDTDTVTLAPFASTAVKAVPDSQRIAGEKIGTLTIKDGSNVAGAVSLKYTGLPALRITPQVLDFGAILEGEAKPQGKMLSLESLAVGNIPCTITAQGGENWSYLPSFTVEKGLQTQISIQPQKNTAGVYDTELVITAGGVEHRVPVKYTVVKPTGIMTVKPETTLTLTQGYAAQKVVGLLTNTGEVALDVRYTGGGVLELSSFDGDLAPGQSAAPCVAIPEGLAPSTYKGTFTFTADNGDTGTWTVTVIVEPKAEQFPPTGDSSRLALWAALLAISGGCLLAMGKGKMKEN